MGLLTAGATSPVNDLAASISAELRAGRSARQTFGARDVAFSWTAGMPPVIASAVSSALVDGMTFNAVTVKPSGTPVAKVASKAAKPTAVEISSAPVTLSKYAGLATWSLEEQVSTEALAQAIYAVLAQGALIAFDKDVWAALDAADASATTGATWTEAILNGQAGVLASGGSPDLLIMAGADYAAAVEGSVGSAYNLSPTDAVPSLFGMRIVVSAGATAGKAFVADSAAILVVEHSQSPSVVADPFTLAGTNELRLVADLLAGCVVSAPGSIAEISVTP